MRLQSLKNEISKRYPLIKKKALPVVQLQVCRVTDRFYTEQLNNWL